MVIADFMRQMAPVHSRTEGSTFPNVDARSLAVDADDDPALGMMSTDEYIVKGKRNGVL
jgi:hypothetical protein